MRCLVTSLLFLIIGSRGLCNEITESPKKTFKIVQQHSMEGADKASTWTQTLFFANRQPGIELETGISWPALYYVSPDERWMLRIQKWGSGDNISYLYRIEPNGRVSRVEEQIGALAFDYVARTAGVVHKDVYHTGISFTSWDMKAGLLHFTVHGSHAKQRGKGLERSLAYKLREHRIVPPP